MQLFLSWFFFLLFFACDSPKKHTQNACLLGYCCFYGNSLSINRSTHSIRLDTIRLVSICFSFLLVSFLSLFISPTHSFNENTITVLIIQYVFYCANHQFLYCLFICLFNNFCKLSNHLFYHTIFCHSIELAHLSPLIYISCCFFLVFAFWI